MCMKDMTLFSQVTILNMMCDESLKMTNILNEENDSAILSDTSLKVETPKTESDTNDEEKDETKTDEKPSEAPINTIPPLSAAKTREEILAYADARVQALLEMDTWDNKTALSNLKGIKNIYWDKKKHKAAAGDRLVENGFSGRCKLFMGS